MKKKFYAVARGRKPGIYEKWFGPAGAEAQVRGFQGARYKGFETLMEAKRWLEDPVMGHAKTRLSPRPFDKLAGASTQGRRQDAKAREATTVLSGPVGVVAYTDGGCSKNPGPGGYGVVIKDENGTRELSGGYKHTTNNRMELMGCIVALENTESKELSIVTDSKYVCDAMTKGWVRKWESNNWMRNKEDRAVNVDLWKRMLALCKNREIDFHWVKGHAGHLENERCDELAVAAWKGSSLSEDKGYPG